MVSTIMNIESQICSEELIATERSIALHVHAIVFEKIIIDGHLPILRFAPWPFGSQVLSSGPLGVEIEIGREGKEEASGPTFCLIIECLSSAATSYDPPDRQ
jgi:hypothetical protein